MKRRVLSFLLAVVLVFGAFVPVFECFTAVFDVQAVSAVPSTGNKIITVNTVNSLRYALKYAEAGSTIVVDDDMSAEFTDDISVEVGAAGQITLDLSGCALSIAGGGADFIRLTKATELYIISSQGGEAYFSRYADGVDDISLVSVENKDAQLHIYGDICFNLSNQFDPNCENTNGSVFRFENFAAFRAYGLQVQTSPIGSCAIRFDPATADAFKNSAVYLSDAELKGYESAIFFNKNISYFQESVGFSSFEIGMKDFSARKTNAPVFGTEDTCDIRFNEILADDSVVLRSADNSIVVASKLLEDVDYGVRSVIDRNKDGAYDANDKCDNATSLDEHGSLTSGTYNNILYARFAHFRQCKNCSYIERYMHYTEKTDYLAPTADAEGRSAGEYCTFPSVDDKHYDTTAPVPAANHTAKTLDMIFISTEEDFVRAMYDTTPGRTLCLTENLYFNDENYPGLVLTPQAKGDLTIDLNGRNIYIDTADAYTGFYLDSYDSEQGAIRLHIVNSVKDAQAQIVYRSNSSYASMFVLAHPAAGLYVYPGVTLTTGLSSRPDAVDALSRGADTITLYAFNELHIYGAEIINNAPKGNCLYFYYHSDDTVFNHSCVAIDSSRFSSVESCIDFNSLPENAFRSFKIGSSSFTQKAAGTDAARLATDGTLTVKNILASGNNLYYNSDFKNIVPPEAYLLSLEAGNEIFVSQGTTDRCEDHQLHEILIDGRFHYLKCELCGKVVDRIEHERIVPDEDGDCTISIYREYNCECGCTNVVSFTGHDLKYVPATKTDCGTDGYLEYYECRDCGALFDSAYGGSKKQLSDFFVPAGTHNCVNLVGILALDCEHYAEREWECDRDYCDYTESTVLNDEWPTGHWKDPIHGTVLTKKHNSLAPTCTEKGYSGEFYTCARPGGCSGMYKDKELTIEITEEDLDIPALGHDYSEGFEYIFDATCVDDGLLRHSCSREDCGYVYYEVIPAEGHAFDEGEMIYVTCGGFDIRERTCLYCDTVIYEKSYSVESEHSHTKEEITLVPTCTTTGNKKISCVYCGEFYKNEEIAALGHDTVKVEEDPASCTVTGTKAHYKCTRDDCGKLFRNEEGTLAITDPAELIIPATKCIGTRKLVAGKENTCTEDGWFAHYKCTVCDKIYTGADTVIEFDPYEFMEARGHSLSERKAKPATCTASGTIAYYECAGQFGCGAKFLDAAGTQPVTDITDPAKAHKLYAVAEVAPSCTERGYKAHYRCELGCGLYFSDDKGTVAVDPDSLFIPYAHTPGEWEITREATPEQPGQETLKCKLCSQIIQTRSLAYVAPDYILGDVNLNGTVEVADARLALRASVGLEHFTGEKFKAADINKNAAIETSDARKILRAAVGLETLE